MQRPPRGARRWGARRSVRWQHKVTSSGFGHISSTKKKYTSLSISISNKKRQSHPFHWNEKIAVIKGFGMSPRQPGVGGWTFLACLSVCDRLNKYWGVEAVWSSGAVQRPDLGSPYPTCPPPSGWRNSDKNAGELSLCSQGQWEGGEQCAVGKTARVTPPWLPLTWGTATATQSDARGSLGVIFHKCSPLRMVPYQAKEKPGNMFYNASLSELGYPW